MRLSKGPGELTRERQWFIVNWAALFTLISKRKSSPTIDIVSDIQPQIITQEHFTSFTIKYSSNVQAYQQYKLPCLA